MTGKIVDSGNLKTRFCFRKKKLLFFVFCHENLVCLAASGFRETPAVRVGNQILVAIFYRVQKPSAEVVGTKF